MSYAARIRNASKKKGCAHFDCRVTYNEVAHLVENPEYVEHHAFYPLISTTLNSRKYLHDDNIQVSKDRKIAYAAHLDHRIYQCYALKWSDLYESELQKHGGSDCVAAYRPESRQSNITAAAKVFTFIRSLDRAIVVTGDFCDFFSSLDHDYLIDSMGALFDGGKLPADHYSVFKSVIKYSEWELDDILKLRGYDIEKSRSAAVRKFNAKEARALTKAQFVINKKKYIKAPWRKGPNCHQGIPQGLAVSGVLANIYMLRADTAVNDIIRRAGGLYLRYCDDFIIVLPWNGDRALRSALSVLTGIPGIELHQQKTKEFRVCNHNVFLTQQNDDIASAEGLDSHISYLGFDFNGREVSLRGGTIGRFFNRYYRRVRKLQRNKRGPTEKQIKAMYRSFSEKGDGAVSHHQGMNFFSYVRRSQEAFPDDPLGKPFDKMYHRLKRDLSSRRSNE